MRSNLTEAGYLHMHLSGPGVDKDPRLCVTYSAYLHILLRRIPLVVAPARTVGGGCIALCP